MARELANRLGFRFLDTGAMYRAVAWTALQDQIDLDDEAAIGKLVEAIHLEVGEGWIRINGVDVTEAIRSTDVTAAVRHVADNPTVRNYLSAEQQRLAGDGNIVTEGRDQGTFVFPKAECKIFLTATPEERARRRQEQLQRHGPAPTLSEILDQQNQRDYQDAHRPVGRLVKADDAIEIISDGMQIDQVLDRIVEFLEI